MKFEDHIFGGVDKKKVEEARNIGRKAFRNKIKCAPILDEKFMQYMKKYEEDKEHKSALFKAWTLGWLEENLKEE